MLDRTTKTEATVELTSDEIEIFSRAVAAGHGLRRTFDAWIDIAAAIEVAQRHADAGGGGKKTRGIRRMAILEENGLGWVNHQSSEIVRLGQVKKQLPAVLRWRETLTDYQRARWSSPQSIFNRCPVFHKDSRKKVPVIKAKPMSVSELLRMPADDIALMLYRRSPGKMFAIMRSMEELAAAGSAAKPRSGWSVARERESQRGMTL